MFDQTTSGGGQVGEIVVATATRWPVRVSLVLIIVLPILTSLAAGVSLAAVPVFMLFLVVAAFIDLRVGAMRLAVSANGVEVVNFMSSHLFDLSTVQIETEEEKSPWPADDLPQQASGEAPLVGSLYLSDESGHRVRVGVVPSFGKRLLTIVEDLKIAIAKHRL